jgi:hypothetical protein
MRMLRTPSLGRINWWHILAIITLDRLFRLGFSLHLPAPLHNLAVIEVTLIADVAPASV